MGLKEDFFAWKEANLSASKKEKKAKLEEMISLQAQGAQRNIERAKQMFPEDKLIPAMEQGPEKFQEELKYQSIPQTTRSMYPRISRSMARGESFNPVAGIADVSSMGGRYVDAAINKAIDGDPMAQRMEQTEGKGLLSSIASDPMVPFSMGIGGATASGVGTGLWRKGLEYIGRTGMLEAGQALGSQAEQMSRGEDFSAGELIGETALGTALPFGIKASKTGLGNVTDFTKDVISEATNRSRELLDIIGARELKQGIRHKMKKSGQKIEPDEVLKKYSEFAEGAEKSARAIIKSVDDLDVKFEEKNKIVKEAIRNMEPVDTSQFMRTLNNSKYLIPEGGEVNYPNEAKFNKMINSYMFKVNERIKAHNPEMMVETLQETSTGAPKYNLMTGRQATKDVYTRGRTIPASEIYELRKEIDKTIDWNANEFSKSYYKPIQKFKKDARTFLKNTLEEKALKMGNKEYSNIMRKYHKLLGQQEKAKRLLTPKTNDLDDTNQAQKLLIKVANVKNLAERKWAKDWHKVTGHDILGDAEFRKLANEYNGNLPMINDYKTGAKLFASKLMDVPLVGGTVGLAVGSPKVGAALYGAMDKGEEMYSEGLAGLSKYSPALRTVQRSAIQQGIGE